MDKVSMFGQVVDYLNSVTSDDEKAQLFDLVGTTRINGFLARIKAKRLGEITSEINNLNAEKATLQ